MSREGLRTGGQGPVCARSGAEGVGAGRAGPRDGSEGPSGAVSGAGHAMPMARFAISHIDL